MDDDHAQYLGMLQAIEDRLGELERTTYASMASVDAIKSLLTGVRGASEELVQECSELSDKLQRQEVTPKPELRGSTHALVRKEYPMRCPVPSCTNSISPPYDGEMCCSTVKNDGVGMYVVKVHGFEVLHEDDNLYHLRFLGALSSPPPVRRVASAEKTFAIEAKKEGPMKCPYPGCGRPCDFACEDQIECGEMRGGHLLIDQNRHKFSVVKFVHGTYVCRLLP